jgi:hypothetical protein
MSSWTPPQLLNAGALKTASVSFSHPGRSRRDISGSSFRRALERRLGWRDLGGAGTGRSAADIPFEDEAALPTQLSAIQYLWRIPGECKYLRCVCSAGRRRLKVTAESCRPRGVSGDSLGAAIGVLRSPPHAPPGPPPSRLARHPRSNSVFCFGSRRIAAKQGPEVRPPTRMGGALPRRLAAGGRADAGVPGSGGVLSTGEQWKAAMLDKGWQ